MWRGCVCKKYRGAPSVLVVRVFVKMVISAPSVLMARSDVVMLSFPTVVVAYVSEGGVA